MTGMILETSTEKGLIVLTLKGVPTSFKPLSGGPELSKTLALEVKNLLGPSCRPDFIAVGTGPGSYTGIRVGVALAKALSFGWQIPLVGFCSLKAFAPCPVLVDARMGGGYLLKNFHDETVLLSPAAVAIELRNAPFFSSPHPDRIKKRFALSIPGIETAPNPHALAVLTFQQFLTGKLPPLHLSYLAWE